MVTIRAGGAWEAWMGKLREAMREQSGLPVKVDNTTAIDAALAAIAPRFGLPAPPPRF